MPAEPFILGANEHTSIDLPLRMANRHGLISGATGTGKTVTLQRLAEGYARAGVPVFLSDIKGDLSGLARPIEPSERIEQRVQQLRLADYQPQAMPVLFWDLYGHKGLPVRATITDMGPLLLASLLQLNDTQTGILYALFRIADDQGLLLLDMKDLRALLSWASEQRKALQAEYGSLSPASMAAIQRRLLVLEEQGGEHFFGEPAVELSDLMQTDFNGNGVISVLDATSLMAEPRLYAMFLLWLLAELFEQLPERGDAAQPRLVFFFDEAHLLFDDAPKVLQDKIEQVVRLIRSKGVGIFFVTQSPLDIPDEVLGQLGNRVQHALRAYTPRDQRAVRAAAQTFRANPRLDTETTITELGVGEALVSVLDEQGRPTPVEKVLIAPPTSRIGPLSEDERAQVMARNPLRHRYQAPLDRESAYEILRARAQREAVDAEREARVAAREKTATRGRRRPQADPLDTLLQSTARTVGNRLGRELVRGLLGSLRGSRRR